MPDRDGIVEKPSGQRVYADFNSIAIAINIVTMQGIYFCHQQPMSDNKFILHHPLPFWINVYTIFHYLEVVASRDRPECFPVNKIHIKEVIVANFWASKFVQSRNWPPPLCDQNAKRLFPD